MSLKPAAIVLDPQGQMFVAIDDGPEYAHIMLIPCSFEHRQIMPAVPHGWEVHNSGAVRVEQNPTETEGDE